MSVPQIKIGLTTTGIRGVDKKGARGAQTSLIEKSHINRQLIINNYSLSLHLYYGVQKS